MGVRMLAAGALVAGGLGAGITGAATSASAASPAGKAPPATTYYVALGDSLAAGVGSTGGKGYVNDVFKKESLRHKGLVLENLSCSGATTTSMLNGGGCSYTTGSQEGDAEAFLAAHPGQVAFVTVDIGANDVDGCTDGTSINQACVDAGLQTIATNVPLILSGLHSAGGTTPVFGMTYYDPFLAAWVLLGSSGQSLAEQSVTLADNLNSALTGDYGSSMTADTAGAFDTDNFTIGAKWRGTKVPVNVGHICHWTLMCTETNIHANNMGHAKIAKAFETVIGPVLALDRRVRP